MTLQEVITSLESFDPKAGVYVGCDAPLNLSSPVVIAEVPEDDSAPPEAAGMQLLMVVSSMRERLERYKWTLRQLPGEQPTPDELAVKFVEHLKYGKPLLRAGRVLTSRLLSYLHAHCMGWGEAHGISPFRLKEALGVGDLEVAAAVAVLSGMGLVGCDGKATTPFNDPSTLSGYYLTNVYLTSMGWEMRNQGKLRGDR
jgi:hypothetical protein